MQNEILAYSGFFAFLFSLIGSWTATKISIAKAESLSQINNNELQKLEQYHNENKLQNEQNFNEIHRSLGRIEGTLKALIKNGSS